MIDTAYERHKARCRERQRLESLTGRDVGKIPEVVDPNRRSAALKSEAAFAKAYLKSAGKLMMLTTTPMISSRSVCAPDQQSAIAVALWAALGKVYDPIILAARTRSAAAEILDLLKRELEMNPLLYEDFPNVTHAIRWLQGVYQRRPTCQGNPVPMSIRPQQLILPDTSTGTAGPRILAVKRSRAAIAVAGQPGALIVIVAGH